MTLMPNPDLEVLVAAEGEMFRAMVKCPRRLIRGRGFGMGDEVVECPHESSCVGPDRQMCINTAIAHQRQHEREVDHE